MLDFGDLAAIGRRLIVNQLQTSREPLCDQSVTANLLKAYAATALLLLRNNQCELIAKVVSKTQSGSGEVDN